MSEVSFAEIEPTVQTGDAQDECFAGTVPCIMNLEVFYNTDGSSSDVTVRLTGYGVQQKVLWEGVIDAPPPDTAWIKKIYTSSVAPTDIALPVPISNPPQQMPDNYGLGGIQITYYDYSTGQSVPNCLGLAFFPNGNGSHDVMIVNTSISTALMIGARNIIITDPKMP